MDWTEVNCWTRRFTDCDDPICFEVILDDAYLNLVTTTFDMLHWETCSNLEPCRFSRMVEFLKGLHCPSDIYTIT